MAIERVRLAAERDEARVATEKERLRSTLLASLSHDLRTPLASITGAVTALRQYGDLYDAAARDDLAAMIQDEAERLARFVGNLLDMARLEAGGIRPNLQAMDVGEMIGTALQRTEALLGSIHAKVDIDPALPMLRLDPVLFEQVLVNLLDNAAKYAPPHSSIVIAARQQADCAVITLSDEGPGIPPGDLGRVFDKFHHTENGDRQRAGTGLGLAICRGFVTVLGGAIAVANRAAPATGAVFTITFPASAFAAAPPQEGTGAVNGRNIPLLVVDDDPSIRRLLRTSLGVQGYRVIETGTGIGALETAEREMPEAMLLDLGLPDMDGLEIIRRLRAGGSKLPIVVLSSRGDERGKVEALDLGADDYVTKPFGMAELVARIRTALRHRLQEQGTESIFSNDGLEVDLTRRRVLVRGSEVKLSNKEWAILRLLVVHAGLVLTHRAIMQEVWGPNVDVQYLRIYVRQLRQKIERDPERPYHILTETGVGYRLRSAG